MMALHSLSFAMKIEFEIQGMSCQHCVHAVKSALEKLPGVISAQVTVGHAIVESSRELSRDEVDKALDQEGYRLAH
jgi:copper chaperone CopZ